MATRSSGWIQASASSWLAAVLQRVAQPDGPVVLEQRDGHGLARRDRVGDVPHVLMIALEMKVAGRQRCQHTSGEQPNTVTMPKFSVEPVDNMTYCSASAIGAMKVSEVTGIGLKSSRRDSRWRTIRPRPASRQTSRRRSGPVISRNGACAKAKMTSARAQERGREHARGHLARDRRSTAARAPTSPSPWSATRPPSRSGPARSAPSASSSAKMPSTITTTKERRLPRPSSTRAREPQPFESTMP